jgi:hypothetical protein
MKNSIVGFFKCLLENSEIVFTDKFEFSFFPKVDRMCELQSTVEMYPR